MANTTTSQGTNPSNQQQVIVHVENRSNGSGTAGFIFELLGLLFSWAPVIGWIIWAFGLLFSFIGLFKKPRGLAIVGFLLSLIDVILLIALAGLVAGLLSALAA